MYIQYSSQKKKHSSCVWAKLGFALIRTLNEWKCILPQNLEHYIHYFVVLLVFFCVCARACVVINSCKYITSRKKKALFAFHYPHVASLQAVNNFHFSLDLMTTWLQVK